MISAIQQRLPVEDVLDELKQQLAARDEVILEAPPGAGKTTLVPLALLDQQWLGGQKILLLEPRRIAAKSAAHRMATLLGEQPGQRVGYRMRLDTRVSHTTRIEVITEGILTRMLQHDPSLDGVGLVIFDEFHERNLESDLALSLCLKGRALFREQENDNATNKAESGEHKPLKLLVMSATLDSGAISHLLNNAPVVSSAGRSYPVDIIYGQASKPRERLIDRMTITLQRAIKDNPDSSILAFLPGQSEIRRTAEALGEWLTTHKISGVHLRPLYGNLSLAEQQQAIAPLPESRVGEQKVVLATNIAETSLTIEGIDVVVDSGLVRSARFDPATGMTALHTSKISAASSVQRAGRAGRLRAGKCYRLWSESQQQQLAQHNEAEILSADLAPVAMQLLQWGVDDPSELDWLDTPPPGNWQQALDLLSSLGAIKQHPAHTLTEHGEAMSALPLHPRLAHLLLCGAAAGVTQTAAQLAAVLSERDPLSRNAPDISQRLEILSGDKPCPRQHQGWLHRTRQLARQYSDQLRQHKAPTNGIAYLVPEEQLTGYLLACAYPDRIARQRHSGGYQLANGRSANFSDRTPLAKQQWLAIAEVSSMAGGKSDVIRSATALDAGLFDTALAECVRTVSIAEWDEKTGRFIAEEQEKIGALVLRRAKLNPIPQAAKQTALLKHVRKQGLSVFSWPKALTQWCARVKLVRATEGNNWPDLSQDTLLATLEDWLAPYLDGVKSANDFRQLDLLAILGALLSWEQQQQLNQLAPTRFHVPSGSAIAIDYTVSPPVLAVKLQEMFGCEQTPAVVNGKVSLLVHLLSPAGKPLQITQDLAGFWRTSYHDVKKDMKGRYPKHPWPDDPLIAIATRKTKARLQ
ncbi:MAG: ATP-dependent helicase HrpB, partial [Thiolinea sp.]